MQRFLTIYTPTHKRPQQLARCMASVQAQTVVEQIEHLIIPDYVGHGIDGMFAQIPDYVNAMHGEYVHILGDDDVLVQPNVVERVDRFAHSYPHDRPPLILVQVEKGPWVLPGPNPWPPKLSRIDLSCLIVRRDVWAAHVHDFGKRYEGDFDFCMALANAGIGAAMCPVNFAKGQVGRGKTETEKEVEALCR